MSVWTPKFRQGDTFAFEFIRKEADINDNEQIIDITGYTYVLSMKEDFDDLSHVLYLEKTAGDHPADDPVNGKIVFVVSDGLTELIDAGKYVWDIEETTPGGAVTTVLPEKENYKEKAVVYPEVTK